MKRYSDELHAEVLRRIEQHQGEVFRQKEGKEFTYTISGRTITVEVEGNEPYPFGLSAIEQAIELMPAEGPNQLKELRASSRIWAILMDDRIKQGLYW
jgi:hypothetical protein